MGVRMLMAERQQARYTVSDLETERQRVLREIGILEATLRQGRPRRWQRGIYNTQREQIRHEHAVFVDRLRQINAAIKLGRRAGVLLLLRGEQAPRTEQELIGALYRMFVDTVAPPDRTEREEAFLKLVRDYMMTGRLTAGKPDGQ